MVLQFSTVFLLMSVFSCISSEDEFSSNSEKSSLYIGNPQNEVQLNKYFDVMELDILISALCEKYSNIVKVTTLGQSAVDNITIRAVEISHDVQEKRKLLKPMIKFVANRRADDGVAYALMVSLIQYLVYSDGYDNRITNMLNTTDISIIPTFNMDSLKKSAQIRTSHAFIEDLPFAISANIKGGSSIGSFYFFDHLQSSYEPAQETLNYDNAFLKKLVTDYAELNSMMKPGTATKLQRDYGQENPTSIQKYNYYYPNCFEISVNISCSMNVSTSALPKYWYANLESTLKLIESVHQGIFGLVKDKQGKPVKHARISVKGTVMNIRVTEDGEYWRLLVPGESYNITAWAYGYTKETKSVDVTEARPYVRVDFVLTQLRVYGTVKDQQGNPVKEASIDDHVKDIWDPIKVNEHGEYSRLLKEQEPGDQYYIRASAPGYTTETKSVVLPEHKPIVRVDFVLNQLGVYGVVKDTEGNLVKEAVIKKKAPKNTSQYDVSKKFPYEINKKMEETSIEVNKHGEYFMPLLMGVDYKLIVSAPGYKTDTTSVRITKEKPHIQLNFKLKRPFIKCSGK